MASPGQFCEALSHSQAAESLVSNILSTGKHVSLKFYMVLLIFSEYSEKWGFFGE